MLNARLMLLVVALMTGFTSLAQEETKVDINVNKGGDATWYTNPIVWVVGAAIFILLLVALLRGRR
jgi:cell division protein FtsW (lipid II flippase)